MEKEFEGKVVIVTGASSGLGEVFALRFARQGAMVTLCGRNKDRLEAAVEKCRKEGGGDKTKFISVCGDATDSKVLEQIVENTVEHFKRLDTLICNHGIVLGRESLLDWTEDDYDSVMTTNLKAPFFLIQKAVPYLEKTKGNIINISSVASKLNIRGILIYSMSKVALDYMTRSMALELGPRGIRVNSVNPTQVATPIQEELMKNSPTLKILTDGHPLEPRMSTMDEQADMVLFLASDRAKFVTGQNIMVDGGLVARGVPDGVW